MSAGIDTENATIDQREEIGRTFDLFFKNNTVRELRAFNVYVNDFEPRAGFFALASERDFVIEQVLEWDQREAKGVYFTLNPVDLNRVEGEVPNLDTQLLMQKGLPATDDAMQAREWILIDVDPTRDSGISSTDDEHNLALITAKRIYKYLRNMGWPAGILADSGNGFHLLYKTMPEPEIEKYLSKALRTLEYLFNTDSVEVDVKVFNPSRITRFYGTYARKGEPTPDRPHRCSHLAFVPDTVSPISAKHVAELANLYPISEKEEASTSGAEERFTQLDLWIRKSGLAVRGPRPWLTTGRKWILPTCPFNPEHVDDSAYIVQLPSGAIKAGCLHKSCANNGWHTLTEKYGPLNQLVTIPQAMKAELSLGGDDNNFHPLPPEIEIEKPIPAGRYPLTDMGNAARFAHSFGQTTRYVNAERRWLTWNGNYWTPDDEAGIDQRCKQIASAIKREGMTATSKTLAQATMQWGQKSQSAGALASMKSLVKSEVPIACSPSLWDANPWVFNLKNGTFYLDRDEFSKPSMDDYCSKVSGTTYDPEAKAPRWEQFLHDIMGGNQEKIDYLQRVAGYCMTGSVKEQVIFFFIGTGRNGKSTFLEIIRHILGSYSKVGAPDLLTTNRVGESKHPAGIADMVGARLVVCSEADKGSYLSEATVKMITGEEALKARHMGKDWFTFQATQKIVVLANHKPIVRGTDNGIWRRIHVVPFDVVISEAKQDRDLLLKLKREAAGIFNWMLEGFRKYRDIGLKPPEEVQAAVKDYRESMDILADFLNEECVLEKRSEVPLSELYNAYTMFCAGRGDKAISNKAFSSSLVERGYRKDRNARGTIFHGIDLKSR